MAGHAAWAAGGAARAGARAAAIGGDAERAARGALSAGLRGGLRVKEPERGSVTVTVRIQPVLGLRIVGHTSATARFRPQE